MITKILGIADILTALLFFLNNTLDKTDIWLPNRIILILGIYLLVKGLIFIAFLDFASILDVICGIIILISLNLIISPLVSILVIFFLLQKGILSMISS